MAKVTGIGGVFFKSTNDHKKLAEWYSQNLGIQIEPWGSRTLGAHAVGRKKQNEVTIGGRGQEPPERLLNHLRLPLGSGIHP